MGVLRIRRLLEFVGKSWICLMGLVTLGVARGEPPQTLLTTVGETPDFQRHVVPLLGRLGCNGRACHGSFQGRGGLRLSLFGYDFDMDHVALTDTSSAEDGFRVDKKNVEESLILQKPLLRIDHEGGQRFKEGSWEHQLLRKWIAAGGKGINEPRELEKLVAEPEAVVFNAGDDKVSLRVVAHWKDGIREEVTSLCRFRSNNDSVVTIDGHGQLVAQGPGDTHVIAFYDNGVAAVSVMQAAFPRRAPKRGIEHPIDRFVDQKLATLGIVPSELCTDAEFLRRVSIDVTATLPTPDEVRSFLADASTDKRDTQIRELLDRPEYAAWWANKICDFTGCNPRQQAELGQELAVQWYEWIRRRVRANMPYDELVEGIFLATGRLESQDYEGYAAEVSSYFRDEDPVDFAQRSNMPHYWSRRSVKEPKDKALAVAHSFLGIRLQCAQCHKHPWDQWTQTDFEQFTSFFEDVTYGIPTAATKRYAEMAKEVGLKVRGQEGAAIRPDVFAHAQDGKTIPWRELYVASRDEPVELSLLRTGNVLLQPTDDPREPIMRWMRNSDNPWFARALVNRVWASYFHAGLIEPTDDLNPANPPSNPELLQWLEENFIASGFDLKWLHFQILSSDTYQRSWRPSETNRQDTRNYSRAIPHRISAEVVYDALKQVTAASSKQDEVRRNLERRASGHLSMRLAGTYAMNVFGKPDRGLNCDCERVNDPTLLQSVFIQNDPLVRARIAESEWIAEIRAAIDSGAPMDARSLIKEAYLRSVSRLPTESETLRAKNHFDTVGTTTDGLKSLLWALINTKEFMLQH